MSVLATARGQGDVGEAILTVARPLFARAIWAWYHANEDRVLVSLWIYKVRLRALRGLIEEIAGPEVEDAPP